MCDYESAITSVAPYFRLWGGGAYNSRAPRRYGIKLLSVIATVTSIHVSYANEREQELIALVLASEPT